MLEIYLSLSFAGHCCRRNTNTNTETNTDTKIQRKIVKIYLSLSLAGHCCQRRAEGGKHPLHLGTSVQFSTVNIVVMTRVMIIDQWWWSMMKMYLGTCVRFSTENIIVVITMIMINDDDQWWKCIWGHASNFQLQMSSLKIVIIITKIIKAMTITSMMSMWMKMMKIYLETCGQLLTANIIVMTMMWMMTMMLKEILMMIQWLAMLKIWSGSWEFVWWITARNVHDRIRKWLEMFMMGSGYKCLFWITARNVYDRITMWLDMFMICSYLKDIVCFLLNLEAVEPDRTG